MNEESEFQRLFHELQPLLRRFLIARFGNEADADDVVQDALVKLHQVAQTEKIENPKALAFSIARNLGRLRREVFNAEWFSTINQAQTVIRKGLKQYNHVRPHQALNMRPPIPETLIESGP
jgi:DNA-directed RNA polymerase specialized sigma24 family protein